MLFLKRLLNTRPGRSAARLVLLFTIIAGLGFGITRLDGLGMAMTPAEAASAKEQRQAEAKAKAAAKKEERKVSASQQEPTAKTKALGARKAEFERLKQQAKQRKAAAKNLKPDLATKDKLIKQRRQKLNQLKTKKVAENRIRNQQKNALRSRRQQIEQTCTTTHGDDKSALNKCRAKEQIAERKALFEALKAR
jgi:hypothetical protein